MLKLIRLGGSSLIFALAVLAALLSGAANFFSYHGTAWALTLLCMAFLMLFGALLAPKSTPPST